MNKIYKWITAVCLLLASMLTVNAQNVEPTKGIVRVKLQTEVATKVGTKQLRAANGRLRTGVNLLDAATKEIKAMSIRPMFIRIGK